MLLVCAMPLPKLSGIALGYAQWHVGQYGRAFLQRNVVENSSQNGNQNVRDSEAVNCHYYRRPGWAKFKRGVKKTGASFAVPFAWFAKGCVADASRCRGGCGSNRGSEFVSEMDSASY
jgi:hypothetical protein